MVTEYLAEIDGLVAQLTPQNHSLAEELLRLPDSIRGYGHVKEAAVKEARDRQVQLRDALKVGMIQAAE